MARQQRISSWRSRYWEPDAAIQREAGWQPKQAVHAGSPSRQSQEWSHAGSTPQRQTSSPKPSPPFDGQAGDVARSVLQLLQHNLADLQAAATHQDKAVGSKMEGAPWPAADRRSGWWQQQQPTMPRHGEKHGRKSSSAKRTLLNPDSGCGCALQCSVHTVCNLAARATGCSRDTELCAALHKDAHLPLAGG